MARLYVKPIAYQDNSGINKFHCVSVVKYSGVIDNMKHRNLEIIFAFLLAILLPSLMISMIPNNRTGPDNVATIVTTEETVSNETQMVSVLMDDGNVEQMELEQYVLGVVLREMPAEFDAEALKAQAVVARTYTLRRMEQGSKHGQADICIDPACCQGFYQQQAFIDTGESFEMLSKVSDAVMQTKGQVLTFQGALIEATYFSCSGGMTEDAAAVWDADIPYLQSVASPGEENASHFTDKVTFTSREFNEKMGGKFTGFPESWLETVTYTQGGGVEEIRICGHSYRGTEVRNLLSLRSTAFAIHIVADTVTITTKGYGHRVGMSQYGAEAMAAQGSSYQDILSHYYRGAVLSDYGRLILN